MDNHKDLFDELEFEGDAIEKTGEISEESTKENITKAAKDVLEEIKPDLVKNLDELFEADDKNDEKLLDDEDYLKKTMMESLLKTETFKLKDIEVSIMKQEDGKYSVYASGKKKSELKLVHKDIEDHQEAAEKGTDHALKTLFKNKPSKTTKPATPPAPKKEPYKGPRLVKVWGRELFTETDPEVTEEQIVEKISRDFGLPEFRQGKVTFDLDEEHGILNVGLMFNKKG